MRLNQDWKYSKNKKVYVEKNILGNDYVNEILKKLDKPEVIEINHYKNIFNRKNQNITYQKNNQSIILAENKDKIIYKGSRVCNDFGYENFYYIVNVMNCPYNCEYCFLKGMYPSSHMLIFVNYEDIMKKLKSSLKVKSYLSISYECDLMAFEKIHGLNKKWINFAENNKHITIESRTKSVNFHLIEGCNPIKNFILSWSLSPQEVIDKYESKTPGLKARINCINSAVGKGWKVKIFVEPVLRIDNGVKIYKKFFLEIKEKINVENIDVNMDFFRINKDYLKSIKKVYKTSEIFSYPFVDNNGILEYRKAYKDSINREFIKLFR